MPRYDLEHFVMSAGKIGGLMTLATYPVVAGDRFSLRGAGVFRMSPLRRNLTLDAKIDIIGFNIPYRHIYGDSWIDFIKQGVDEQITFQGIDLGAGEQCGYLGGPYIGTVARWLPVGYNQIWNRYARQVTWDEDELSETDVPSSNENRTWGRECAWLPTIWNTPIKAEVDDDDTKLDIEANKLDLIKLQEQKARLLTERRREFFAEFYNNVLKATFGTTVNIDADQRPDMLFRHTQWLSGYDVDGTDAGSLGQYSGKAATAVAYRMPTRRFNEHGTLWIMALVRFPTIHVKEVPYLSTKVDPSYHQIAGDPDIIANTGPEQVNANDYFANPGAYQTDIGRQAYGQHYRYHPSTVHQTYNDLEGYPFTRGVFTAREHRYCATNEYDQVFQTTQLGHWNCQLRHDVVKTTGVAVPEASIFAGSR